MSGHFHTLADLICAAIMGPPSLLRKCRVRLRPGLEAEGKRNVSCLAGNAPSFPSRPSYVHLCMCEGVYHLSRGHKPLCFKMMLGCSIVLSAANAQIFFLLL